MYFNPFRTAGSLVTQARPRVRARARAREQGHRRASGPQRDGSVVWACAQAKERGRIERPRPTRTLQVTPPITFPAPCRDRGELGHTGSLTALPGAPAPRSRCIRRQPVRADHQAASSSSPPPCSACRRQVSMPARGAGRKCMRLRSSEPALTYSKKSFVPSWASVLPSGSLRIWPTWRWRAVDGPDARERARACKFSS